MEKTHSLFKKITSLLLSLVFVFTSFAVVDFSQSTAIEAKADGEEYFLMSYFTGNLQTEQQIRFAVSTDGINFKPLNGGNAILQEKSSDTNNYNGYSYTDGVRDPFIFDGHDGYYYCIATDLDATAYGFSGNQSQMVLWRSADLITWSDAFYINVAKILNDHGVKFNDAAYDNSNLKRTWAPQVFYENGEYMIYFAFYADGFSSTRMHYMTTTDLFDISKYSAPEVLYDPGYDDIDADIIKEGDTYYMFYKDETPGRKTVCLASSNNLKGPYSYVGQFATSSTTGGIEGCQVYTIGSNYYLVADRYGDAGRFVIYNLGNSLANVAAASVAQSIPVNDGNPITTVDETNGFHNLTARHGSIMHISSTEYNALCAKYGGVTNNDIMYNFTTGINQGAGYGTYNDSSLRDINFMGDGNMYVNHDSGYARLYNKCLFVNDDDVRAMFPDDVYTVSFDYSLETTTNLGAPIFALGDNSAADYVMIFGNGDMWVRKSGESTDTKVGNAPLSLGVSYHYDVVSDGTNIIFYRDGKQIGSIAATVDFPSSGVRYAAFGFSDAHNSYGYGNYSHIRFRNSAVSAATIGAEFNEKLLYKNDSGEDTVNGKSGVLNVSNSGSHSYTDAFVSHNSSSYTFAGWVNPGATVNANVIMGIGSKERRNHAPYGRYFIFEEDGTIRFNYCSGSSSGGNWSQHYVDIFNAFTLTANTWSYLQVNIVPVNTNQVKLTVYMDGVSTYSSDITLTTKVDGENRTGNDYCYGMLGFMQLPTNHVYLGNMFDPAWYQVADDTSYVKDVRVYTQAMDPAYLYQAEVAEEYVKANISAGYLPTFNQEAYHQGSLATNGYANLVYAPVWTTYWNTCAYNSSGSRNQYNQNGSSSGELTCGHVNHLAYKMPMPTNSVMVYDGEHTPATPVELELWSYGGWGKLGELYFKGTDISGTNFDKFILNEYWYGFSNDYTQWVGTTYNESNYSAKNDDWNGKVSGRNNIYDDTRHDGSTHMFWWNRLNYQGTGDYNNYYEKFSTITFGVYSTTNDNNYGKWTTEHVQNEGANIYVLNYKPVYDILKNSGFTGLKNGDNGTKGMSIKAVALTMGESEDLYTTSSVEQFYLAMYKLMKCDPNNYLSNSTASGDVETQVQNCAAAIKDAVLAFEGVNLELRANFSTLDSTRSSAISTHLSTLGEDSQTKTTSSLNALQATLDSLEYTTDKTTAEQRADMSANAYQTAISAEKAAIDTSVAALDTIANMSTFDTAYASGRNILLELDGKQAQYKAAAINNLKTALTTGSTVAYANSDDETRLDYGQAVQTTANGYATAITNAVNALTDDKNANFIDVSAFNPAYNKITKLDTDAYDDESTSISSAISGAEAAVTYTTAVGYDGATINVIDNSVDQADVDAAVSTMLTALSNSVKKYNITATAGVEISSNNGTYEDGKASYGTKMTFDSKNADTAWYMSYRSGTTARAEQYLGYGARVSTNLLGDLNVRAVKKTVDTPYMVTINRNYDDNTSTHGIILRTYSSSTYTLPAAPEIAYYDFVDYTYNGVHYDPDDEITITGNHAVINANYEHAADNAYTVKISSVSGNGDLYNQSAAFNTKIEKSAPRAYGWVKVEGGKETMFYVGSDLTYFVTDSIELKAVASKPTGYTGVPTVYLRDGGAVKTPLTDGSGKKKISFNGMYVTDGFEVVEYGILLGKAKAGGAITDADVIVENAGSNVSEDYSILRAKATKTVGANQFSIGVTTSMSGTYKYRGYVMYVDKNDSNQIKTVYTGIINDTI